MKILRGKTVLITGGVSGIGLLLGRRFLAQGAAHLVIWDVQQQALHDIVSELTGQGFHVSGYLVDLADPARITAAAEEMRAAGVEVDIVINNAGVIIGKTFAEHSTRDIALTMDVNAAAPLYVAREFLSGMIARRSGHIVNIASAGGMVSNPKMSVYCASKWAIIGWSDSLRIEMEQEKTGVGVTTVTPYYINTGMFAGVRSPFIPILDAEYVADRIIAAVKSNRIFLRLPWIINFLPLLRGLLPVRWFDRIGGQWLGIYHTMDDFRGRK
ncbi:SDR family oxidoreductase [Agrobacterium sp. BA1120]|uniref:SDR family oxidoreductase n=1 Tax=Agrobacterium sp. BA1120 TaxID=3228927 RepID=UPI00336ACF2B